MGDKTMLAKFMKSLKDKDVLDFNKNSFVHRLKLQKYVFIARKFGFDMGYDYSLYVHGPYSTDLADDYYAINNLDNAERTNLDSRFIKIIKDKSKNWLEFASTVIMINDRYEHIDTNELVELVKSAKPHATNEELIEIIGCLKESNCIP